MSRYRIALSHRETCICTRCIASRRKATREAERSRRLPAEGFAARLAELRREGPTYKQLAERSGLSAGTCHRILNHDVQVNPRSQEMLSAIFE